MRDGSEEDDGDDRGEIVVLIAGGTWFWSTRGGASPSGADFMTPGLARVGMKWPGWAEVGWHDDPEAGISASLRGA